MTFKERWFPSSPEDEEARGVDDETGPARACVQIAPITTATAESRDIRRVIKLIVGRNTAGKGR